MHAHGYDQRTGGDLRIGNALQQPAVKRIGHKWHNLPILDDLFSVQIDLESARDVPLRQREPGLIGRDLYVQPIPDDLRMIVRKEVLQRSGWVEAGPARVIEIRAGVVGIVTGMQQPGNLWIDGRAQIRGIERLRAERSRSQPQGQYGENGNDVYAAEQAPKGVADHRVDETSRRFQSTLSLRRSCSQRKISYGCGAGAAGAAAASPRLASNSTAGRSPAWRVNLIESGPSALPV